MRFAPAIDVILMLTCAAPAAAWDTGHIGIYADAAGTRACAEVPAGSYTMLYVIATRGTDYRGDMTGAEFRIEVTQPRGWTLNYIPPEGSILIGDPIDSSPTEPHDNSGANVAFSTCNHWDASGHVNLGTLLVRNEGGMPTELLVKRRSDPLNESYPCALFVGCDDPTYYTWCNTPLLSSSCTQFVQPTDPNAGGDCDKPYFVFALDREPDPRWTALPRTRAIDREVLAMLTRRSLIELPEGESEAPLDRAIVNAAPLRDVLQQYAVEHVAKGMPCFDLADTIAMTRTGETVRLTDWSRLWIFTVPPGASRQAFIGELSQLREVAYAEPNGFAVPNSIEGLRFEAPNPFVQRGTLKVKVTRPMPGQVEILDASGRRVKVLLSRHFTAGSNEFFWEGTDDGGRRVPSGVYFVRVVAGDHLSTHKLVLVR